MRISVHCNRLILIFKHLCKQNSSVLQHALPFHSVSPYRGRWCRQWDRPGSPLGKTSPQVSLPLHTGCSESGWSPQTVACQSEATPNNKTKTHAPAATFSVLLVITSMGTYPRLKLRGELCLELADGSWAVVSLDKHLGGDSWLL